MQGTALAACLHLLGRGYATGLIASSHVYETLRFPWGSNPVTDPMLGSASFSIVHDGCDLTRCEKAEVIADWDTAQRHLRVCWQGEHLDRNCGTCIRCAATALCFTAVGRPIPPSIPVSSPGEGVERLRALEPTPRQLGNFKNMVLMARSKRISEPWVAALAELNRSRSRQGRKRWFERCIALRRRLGRRTARRTRP